MRIAVINKLWNSPGWLGLVVTDALLSVLPSWRGGGMLLVFVSPQLMLWGEFDRAQAVQSPNPPFCLFPPSHLIAFDKCPYWLHIIRCSGGSVRLYYSARATHLFSILHGWHTCFCKVRTGPRLCHWNRILGPRGKQISVRGLKHHVHYHCQAFTRAQRPNVV